MAKNGKHIDLKLNRSTHELTNINLPIHFRLSRHKYKVKTEQNSCPFIHFGVDGSIMIRSRYTRLELKPMSGDKGVEI
ncbi:hypothetical protein BLOT_013802 [Blomia tropicalis]|nr:hypothetical protein BLOT_013802 [Blomia tropicalis]